MNIQEAVFLQGRKARLAPIGNADVSAEYLAWLNDPEVLRYRAQRVFPTTLAQLQAWVDSQPSRGDLVLTIRTTSEGRHIGNIALNTILWPHRSAELSIMIGAKDVWGRGYGSEAILLLTAHAFGVMGLHRIWAESPNPAFNAMIRKLGWTAEATKREAFFVDGVFTDLECWSLLDYEWRAGKGHSE